jgi:hypothetical protein
MAFRLTPGGGRAQSHLGVAVGKHWINLCLVARKGAGYEVVATRILAAAERATLPRVAADMGAKGISATFSLVDTDFRHRTVTVPSLARRDLARVVAREAGARPGDAVAWTVRRARGDGLRDVEVRAMPRNVVETLAAEATEAGLSLSDVVPHATSFIMAMTRPADRETGELMSLIEVWDHNADLILTRSGAHVYDRHMNRGVLGRRGEDVSPPQPQAPAPETSDLDAEVAQMFGEIDLAFDLDGSSETDAASPPEPPAEAPADPFAAAGAAPAPAPAPQTPVAWERLTEEIHRTHLYAKKNLKAGEVSRVVLTGPVADDPPFVEWLSGQLRAEVVPLLRHRPDITWRGAPDPRMVIAMGAALAGLSRPSGAVTLVPEELRRREVPSPLAYAAAALLVFALLSAGMGVVFQARAVGEEAARLASLQAEQARLHAARSGTSGPTPLVTPDGVRHPLPDGLPAPLPATALLADLGAAMPPAARLLTAYVTWEKGAWHVAASGEVLAGPAEALGAVGALVSALEATGRFAAVDLSPMNGPTNGPTNGPKGGPPDTGGVTPFSVQLTLKEPGGADPA